VGDLRAGLDDHAAALVAEQVREVFVGALDALDLTELRAADAAGADLDEDLAVAEGGELDLVDQERLALFNKNGGGSLHGMNHQ
jgi:hypothetical protein